MDTCCGEVNATPLEVESSNIAKFLTLPLLLAPSTQYKNTSTPIIEYSKYYIMTNNDYLTQLEKNTRSKDEAEAERIAEKEMERSKLKRQAKKLEKEKEK